MKKGKLLITVVWIKRKTTDRKEISIVPRPDDKVIEGFKKLKRYESNF
jgi:hypothetical protein